MRGTRTARVCAGPIEEDPRLRLRGSIPLWASCDTFDAGPEAWLCGPATLPVVTSPPVARPCRSLASDSLQCPHCRSLRLTVSPAPPSNSTLSGTTTAARPLIFSNVFTCWTKFNCLFDVVVQKSGRL